MARPTRDEEFGAVNHVFAHGVDTLRIFHDDRDRRTYLSLLGEVVQKFNWRCLAYCLMTTHVHLLIETPDANLGAGMCMLHGDFARRFNRRHRRRGHLFERRYGAVRIESDGQLAIAAAYIASNPVKAGLCTMPEDWRWNSFGRVLDGDPPIWLDQTGLLAYFGANGGDPLRRYAAMVRANC